jgi:hypothetical protein
MPVTMHVVVGVAHFAAAEVVGVAVPAMAGLFAPAGKFAVISVIGMEAGVDMAVEVLVPGAGTDE